MLKKFTGKAAADTEALSRRILSASAPYGDDVVRLAVTKAGPKASPASRTTRGDAAAPAVLKFLARHGAAGGAVLTKQGARLLALGDDAARRPPAARGDGGAAAGALRGRGPHRALAAVAPRTGRRLAILGNDLLAGPRAADLVGVIARFGEKAATFIWDHKGALAITGTLAAFLANPEPFINGTKDLAETVVVQAVVPAVTTVATGTVKVADSVLANTVRPAVTEMSKEAARQIPWGALSLFGTCSPAGWRCSLSSCGGRPGRPPGGAAPHAYGPGPRHRKPSIGTPGMVPAARMSSCSARHLPVCQHHLPGGKRRVQIAGCPARTDGSTERSIRCAIRSFC